jgi:4'-phosphopantetheinyl transferase
MNTEPIVSELQPDTVVVYEIATENLSRRARDTMRTLLSPAELSALGEIGNDSRRIEYLASRYLQRHLVARHAKVAPESLSFETNTHGKPAVRLDLAAGQCGQAPIAFNVSHCRERVVVAIGIDERSPRANGLGIDVERFPPRHDVERIIKRFFSPAESNELLELTPSRRKLAFLRSWTRKEAVVKALGDGIAFGLGNFSVPTDPGFAKEARAIDWHVSAPGDFVVFDLDFAPPIIGAVCVPAAVRRVHRSMEVFPPA